MSDRVMALASVLAASGGDLANDDPEAYWACDDRAEAILGRDLLETLASVCTSERWSPLDMLRTAVDPAAVARLLDRLDSIQKDA